MEISFYKLVKILASRLLSIIIISVLCGFASLAYTVAFVKPQYTSSVKLMVSQEGGNQSAQNISIMIRLVNSYIELLDSRDFYAEVANESGLNYSAGAVGRMISYTAKEDSEVFLATVTAATASDCQAIISSLMTCIPPRIESAFNKVTLKVVETPNGPAATSSQRVRNTILGTVAGALLASVVILMREFFDTRCKEPGDLTERYGLPILGTIPEIRTKKRKIVNAPTAADKEAAAEAPAKS